MNIAKAVTYIEYPILRAYISQFKNSTIQISPHCFIRTHGRLSWLIYYGQKNRTFAFYLRYDSENDRYIFECFYDNKRKLKVSKYFRRLMCYPSFIDFLKAINVDPREIIIKEKVLT